MVFVGNDLDKMKYIFDSISLWQQFFIEPMPTNGWISVKTFKISTYGYEVLNRMTHLLYVNTDTLSTE